MVKSSHFFHPGEKEFHEAFWLSRMAISCVCIVVVFWLKIRWQAIEGRRHRELELGLYGVVSGLGPLDPLAVSEYGCSHDYRFNGLDG